MSDIETYTTIRTGLFDMNGRPRGKRMPGTSAAKIAKGDLRMPLSIVNVDIFGADIADSPLLFESGDADGLALPTGRGPVPMPWLIGETAFVPVSMHNEDGTPFPADPRNALQSVLDRFEKRGWNVLAATEMEFYLVNESEGNLTPAARPDGAGASGPEVLSLDDLDAFDAFFTDLYAGAHEMDLDLDAAISEGGAGQFEVNLKHRDAMRAADNAALFKMLVKGVARNHAMSATFLAKPFADDAGNGAHVHFSVVDDQGNNVFDNGTDEGGPLLKQAVAGSLLGLGELALMYFPHASSFDRLVDGAHAPTAISWAYENRTTAVRIPGGPPAARRIEHRVSGGDTCPYVMMTGILAGAIFGIENALEAPDPITGSAYDADLDRMPGTWPDAIAAFENSTIAGALFDPMFVDCFLRTKRQELRLMEGLSGEEIRAIHLHRV